MAIRIWKKILRSLAGTGVCQIGKNESMKKIVEKNPRKKSKRKKIFGK